MAAPIISHPDPDLHPNLELSEHDEEILETTLRLAYVLKQGGQPEAAFKICEEVLHRRFGRGRNYNTDALDHGRSRLFGVLGL